MTEIATSAAVTSDIRVVARPFYLPERSEPASANYVFAYHITITNESETTVQLLSRHWTIIDGDGELEEVEGVGVIGETPILEPGESFEYTSFCPLPTEWGTMEGVYRMMRADGSMFDVEVARFYLTLTQTLVA